MRQETHQASFWYDNNKDLKRHVFAARTSHVGMNEEMMENNLLFSVQILQHYRCLDNL